MNPVAWGGAVLLALSCLNVATAVAEYEPPGIHNLISPMNYTGTETCLICHGVEGLIGQSIEADVMATVHWTWIHTNTPAGKTQVMGKQNIINNYCVALGSNEPRCTSCHIGSGWRDNSFDFNNHTNIDCLVCHDTTGTYKKTPTGAGAPDPGVDLVYVAQNAGRTSRATCGTCHFYGGGGDAVKHGDLDSTMKNPSRSLDVHMGVDGANMSCIDCHMSLEPGATAHDLVGSRYSKRAPDNWLCEDCHTPTPHWSLENGAYYNAHTGRVSCQACHIPRFARGGRATKMTWDWSAAGQKKPDGSDLVIKDENGDPVYDTKKGSFTWEANVVPEYVWFNGDVVFNTLDDRINPAAVTTINDLQGTGKQSRSRIMPVKRFTGVQPYDPVNEILVVPHLFPSGPTDTDAYWKGYNWTNAITAGMSAVGRSFSGQVGWANTEMFWIQNHMVAPKEHALVCADCHMPGGRLDFIGLGYETNRAARLSTLVGFDINLDVQAAGRKVKWLGAPGYRYRIQSCADMSDPSGWVDEADGEFIPTTAGELVWLDGSTGLGDAKFYRVVRSVQP
jgi:octaheme c-type cytochrome (tetrathionate reductase family)